MVGRAHSVAAVLHDVYHFELAVDCTSSGRRNVLALSVATCKTYWSAARAVTDFMRSYCLALRLAEDKMLTIVDDRASTIQVGRRIASGEWSLVRSS